MTKKTADKVAARELAARAGIKYTEALRAVTGVDGPSGSRRVLLLAEDLRPGTVTAVVSGGGATNLAIALPDLIALRNAGHPVIVAARDRVHGFATLPHPLDFAYVGGAASSEQLRALIAGKRIDELRAIGDRAIRVTFAARPLTDAEWRAQLHPGRDGREPVLWVQDVQTDGPLADWPSGSELSEYDRVPVQLSGLKNLAREAGAIVAVGHCTGADDEPGWRVVAGIADRTVVMHVEWRDPFDGAGPEMTLRRVDRDGGDTVTAAPALPSLLEWRSAR